MVTTLDKEKEESKMLMAAVEVIRHVTEVSDNNKIKVTEVAKVCGVSRAWIYKNFGSNNEDILMTAIDLVAPTMTTPMRSFEVWKKSDLSSWVEELVKSLEFTLEQVKSYPFLFKFYFKNRLQNDKIGRHLAHHEHRFISHVVRKQIDFGAKESDLQKLTIVAEYLAAIRMGLVFKWLAETDKSQQLHLTEMRALTIALFQKK